jgi:hypothetical protein
MDRNLTLRRKKNKKLMYVIGFGAGTIQFEDEFYAFINSP